MALRLLALSSFAILAKGHMAVFHKAMYCLNGTVSGQVDYNSNAPVDPLYMLSTSDWWFHHVNQCDEFPPAEGDFLELPAGGSFTVEIAGNRGVTSLSYNGQYATEWGDGQNHPEDYSDSNCITTPNIHTQNQSMAAGSAFAISYESDISKVTMDNLAVFTVRYNTPWKLVASYDVPQDMPACPTDGCTCAWVWIPNGCGQPNIYMQGLKCMVTGATSTTPVATAKAPVWCEEDQSTCTQGAKQILIWNQADGNNIVVNGNDQSGNPKSPGYNKKCGFSDGAQNDIFASSSSAELSSSVIPAQAIAISSVAGGTVPLISQSTASMSTSYGTNMSQPTVSTGSPTAIPVCIPPNPTNNPASTAPLNSSQTTASTTLYTTSTFHASIPSVSGGTVPFIPPSIASMSTAYGTNTSQPTLATGSPTSIPVCGIPPNSINIPTSAAPLNSSHRTTISTLYTPSTFYASSPTSSPAYRAASSNSTSQPMTSPTSSGGASTTSPETCRRRKRMVRKQSHQF